MTLLCRSADGLGVPYPRADLSRDFCYKYAEGGVAAQDDDAGLKFGNLAVEVPRQ